MPPTLCLLITFRARTRHQCWPKCICIYIYGDRYLTETFTRDRSPLGVTFGAGSANLIIGQNEVWIVFGSFFFPTFFLAVPLSVVGPGDISQTDSNLQDQPSQASESSNSPSLLDVIHQASKTKKTPYNAFSSSPLRSQVCIELRPSNDPSPPRPTVYSAYL